MRVSAYDEKTVRLSWQARDDERQWNEACAYAVEHFGLPGDRFETHANEEWMDFEFKDSKDALMFLMGVL